MAGITCTSTHLFLAFLALLVSIPGLVSPVRAEGDKIEWIPYTTDAGTIFLDNDRQPSLYTGAYGDCQGNSPIDVTRFDASLYTDNMTVMIHLEANTKLPTQGVMMLISVWAYGESRLDMMINPCTIDIPTLCPMRPGVPIIANGMLPIGAENLVNVPSIAYSIPDFEGQAILRIFSNSTKSQAACYAASMTNGKTFAHPDIVGTILGFFTLVSIVSSVAVAIYGQAVPETRVHHAHSVSVLVVFAIFQHIFFSGMLSVNWPSVLVAFWSNYAWASGMIYTKSMQESIDKFINNNFGNITMLGALPANTDFSSTGAGYDITQLYKRENFNSLARRSSMVENRTTGFIWYGDAVQPGLPLPGNYSGFAGTLSGVSIPASNAFLTGLIWLLILTLIVIVSLTTIKWILELFIARQWIKSRPWGVFRLHWHRFVGVIVLRLAFIAFFMMTTLALFQFALGGAAGPMVLAAVVLIVFLGGLSGASAYALRYRLHSAAFHLDYDRLHVVASRRGIAICRESTAQQNIKTNKILWTLSWPNLHFVDLEDRSHVHDDVDYLVKFGWLSSRYRRSKWWAFSYWLFYELIRACFYGAAARNSLAQILGLLVCEIIAFVTVVCMKPFESNRLNLVMVYLLGCSKIATVALSLAFDSRFALGRILSTAVGIIIIIIQAVLTVCLLVTIGMGAVSSYMSVMRVRDDSEFKPQRWTEYRARYFANISCKANEQAPAVSVLESVPSEPKPPNFAVTTIRREPKIGEEKKSMHEHITAVSHIAVEQESITSPRISRPASARSISSNVPFGARLSKATWSAKDLSIIGQERMPLDLAPETSSEKVYDTATRRRSASHYGVQERPWSMHGIDYERQAKRRSTASLTNWPVQTPNLPIATTVLRNEQKVSSQPRHYYPREDYITASALVTDPVAWPAGDWSPDDILP